MDAKELTGLAGTAEFQDRVRYFAVKSALAIVAESDQTANHADRLVWARGILNGGSVAGLALGVLTNPTIAASAPNVVDGDVEFAVVSMIDAFAG